MMRWNSPGPCHDPQLSVADKIRLVRSRKTKVQPLFATAEQAKDTGDLFGLKNPNPAYSCQSLPVKTVLIKLFYEELFKCPSAGGDKLFHGFMWLKAFITLTPNGYFATVPVSLRHRQAVRRNSGVMKVNAAECSKFKRWQDGFIDKWLIADPIFHLSLCPLKRSWTGFVRRGLLLNPQLSLSSPCCLQPRWWLSSLLWIIVKLD